MVQYIHFQDPEMTIDLLNRKNQKMFNRQIHYQWAMFLSYVKLPEDIPQTNYRNIVETWWKYHENRVFKICGIWWFPEMGVPSVAGWFISWKTQSINGCQEVSTKVNFPWKYCSRMMGSITYGGFSGHPWSSIQPYGS